MLTQNPSTFLHFPPPFLLDHDELLHNEAFSHPLIMEDDQIFTSLAVPEEAEIELIESLRKDSTDFQINQRETMIMKEARVYRRREKDRHSKIYTAQGPRDRRMRLSVQVARRFFDLQDMLGFDKASKTIEWLFSKSKGPIKELTEKARHLNRGFPCCLPDTGGDPKPRNSTWFDPVAKKEWRQKARERARERTKEKLKMRSMSSCFTKLSSSSAGTKVQSLCHLVSVLENPENQHHCPNSTLINVANPDAGATMNPNNYNFSSTPSLDQSIGHEENQFSFLIRNYIPTSIFGFSTTPAC